MRLQFIMPAVWVGLVTVGCSAEECPWWAKIGCAIYNRPCTIGDDGKPECCLPDGFDRRLDLGEDSPSTSSEEHVFQHRQLQDGSTCILPPSCPEGSTICNDPHMNGLSGQSLDWSGEDGAWYALVHDEVLALQINVRLTAPLPKEFPHRQLVTGVAVISSGRSFVVEVNNPYSTATDGCPNDVVPCLADGGLRIAVDDEEPTEPLRPVEDVQLHDGLMLLSATNLPVECWQFGGARSWAAMYEDMLQGHRVLKAVENLEQWVLRFPNMAAPDWCAKYVSDRGLSSVQSRNAVLRIATPSVTLRVNVGVNYQGDGEQDWDGRILPDMDVWQMDVGLEGLGVGDSLSGILGETARPVIDENGRPIMSGPQAIRGVVEDYRVAGPLGVDFALQKNI